ncbi:MAG: TRAP transporter substrate-binding protein DctP [Deltaproteobacteria bacterium]|nr:TRAP transporter substrate-binding protein DctP [Deltaproteobacteria bacterium]
MFNRRDKLKTVVVFSLAVLVVLLFSLGNQASVASAQEYKLKMACVLGPGTAIWKAGNEFTERVDKATNGQVKIKIYPPGALVGTTEVFEALGKGVIDMAFTTGEYWAGKDPAFAFVTYLPGGFDSALQHDFWLYQRGGIELVRELYGKYNIYCLSLPYYPAEYLTSRVPITSLADIKGKKLVLSGAMSNALFTKLGASTVSMPTGERPAALERGVIDGGDLGVPSTTVAIGADRVAKYMLRPSLHQPSSALELSMGMKLWKSLPENLKFVLEEEAYDLAWRNYRYNVDMDLAALKKMREGGLKEYILPEAEVKEVRKLALNAWEETAQKTELGRKMMEGQLLVMKELGLIE